MPYGGEKDKQYRLNEQQHVETVIGSLHRLVEDDHIRVFGYVSLLGMPRFSPPS
jgi:hypothetical protein